MTKSRCVVAIPIAAALKLRTMFHAYCVLGAVCTPTLIYAWVIYRDPFELVKFNLPTDCFLIGMDHQPWWMIEVASVWWKSSSMEHEKYFGYPVADVGTGRSTQSIACSCRRIWAILRS